MKLYILNILLALVLVSGADVSAQDRKDKLATSGQLKGAKLDGDKLVEPTAWTISQPLGQRFVSTIDTLQDNYAQNFIPSNMSIAYATTGNYGAPGMTQIFFDRKRGSEFFFEDVVETWFNADLTHIPYRPTEEEQRKMMEPRKAWNLYLKETWSKVK